MGQVKSGRNSPVWASAVMAALVLVGACKPAATATAPGATAAAAPTGGAFQSASAPAPAAGMTTFTDPTENAFTISIPSGWTAKGGVQRTSPIVATLYVATSSSDGASNIAIGDPSIPTFVMPNGQQQAGASVANAAGGQSLVEPYESGAQFAADYAQRAYGAACVGMQPAGTQAEPDLVQQAQATSAKLAGEVGVAPPPVQFDGASAHFTCQVGGAPYVVGVLAVTAQQANPMGGGFWSVPIIISYRTLAASQAQTEQMARTMDQSLQHNPQWDAQMADATKQKLAQIQAQGQQDMATMNALQQRQFAALNANEAAANARLNYNHAAFMQQFNAQGAARTAAWNQQMYNKETNHQAEMRVIQNQTCIAWYDAAHTRCSATAGY
jgi:hypothetical protein